MNNYLLLLSGFVLLILGGHWLLKAAVGLSLRLMIPRIIIGMTVVSFATSAPELIVSLTSALEGHADIAIGNVIGSNIANLGLVLGIVTILSTIGVEKSFYKTDWPVMMIASIMLYVFIAFDGVLERYEGVILLVSLIVFLVYLLKFQEKAVVVDEVVVQKEMSIPEILIFLVLGGVGLWGGSELLIRGAVNLANDFGVSERVIGVTIISIGTSIPELAASIIAIIKKEKAISLGNLIGSNIFNILAVLGITSIVTPIIVKDHHLLTSDIIWMLVLALMVLPLVFIPVKMKLSWKEGLILLGFYVVFIALTI
ncbi:MAG: calcium/sodium antiporter [Flavobacteriaceae bacterium]|nr:calcium/sodium antiporter [Flavobacteriaceae bacterium]